MSCEHNGFGKRLGTMVKVDIRRMFTMPLIYIMVGACLVMPVLILVMTTMMDGSVTVDPQTGVETVIEGFDNAWQAIGAYSDQGMMSMDMTGMCNINMLFFFVAVLVCLFVADDFRSGYSKNLFTVRARKGDYVISKTLVCFLGGAAMLLAFFVGTMLGGTIAGLPFQLRSSGVAGLVTCMLCKISLVAVFVPIYLVWSVAAKQKLWLSLVGSFMTGMLLFMMVPMLSPL
ncbi:MAG: ABC transporter permease, partial [Oscillospiraceae bacterium]|nr:ABC transporter permease [Oscillospiraceae bacterium]